MHVTIPVSLAVLYYWYRPIYSLSPCKPPASTPLQALALPLLLLPTPSLLSPLALSFSPQALSQPSLSAALSPLTALLSIVSSQERNWAAPPLTGGESGPPAIIPALLAACHTPQHPTHRRQHHLSPVKLHLKETLPQSRRFRYRLSQISHPHRGVVRSL